MDIIKEKTFYLLGKKRYTKFDSRTYVDWAMELLEAGIDSENIITLAGLINEETDEREKYFAKALKDIDFQMPDDNNEILYVFTNRIANDVIDGLILPRFGLSIMLEIITNSGYQSEYDQFLQLDEDIDRLTYDKCNVTNLDFNLDNIDSYIITEFKLFQELRLNNLFVNDKAYCLNCINVMKPVLKSKFSFRKSKRINEYRCSKCNSNNLLFGNSQKGKRVIIDMFKK